jgi:hypothetical protein
VSSTPDIAQALQKLSDKKKKYGDADSGEREDERPGNSRRCAEAAKVSTKECESGRMEP